MNHQAFAIMLSRISLLLLSFSLVSCGSGTAESSPQPSGPSKAGKPPSEFQGPPPVQVETRLIRQQPLSVTFNGTGNALPYRTVQIAAASSGLVIAIALTEGSQVAAGTPLVTIEKNLWQAKVNEQRESCNKLEAELQQLQAGYLPEEIAQKRAAVKAINVELQRLASELKRKSELYRQKNLSETDWEQVRFAYEAEEANLAKAKADLALLERGFREELIKAATADLKRAQALLAQAEDALGKTVITAPFAGVVVAKKVEVGEWVLPGTVVAHLVDVSKIKVDVAIPENYVRFITMGMPAQITLDAFPSKEFSGTVIEIVPMTAGGMRNFPVRFLVENQDRTIFYGMFCRVACQLRPTANAVMIHADALVRKDKKIFAIKVMPDTTAQFVEIALGERNGEWFEIAGGNSPFNQGDQVVTTNNPQVYPGARLLVVREYK